jgi:signal peptidase II
MIGRAGPLAAAAAIVILDRLTKTAVERSISMWETKTLIPGVLNLVYTRNRGAAFGVFTDLPDPWRGILLIGVSSAVLVYIARLMMTSPVNRWPLALVLGGAIGNLYDRVVFGSVTDFIQVFIGSYEWPSFNVADSAITVGAVLLALDLFRPRAKVADA